MNYGLYLSAAGLKAQESRINVITNNLANSATHGFKRDLAIMRSRANATREDPRMYAYRVPVLEDQGGGVSIVGNGIDLTQGTFDKTANQTDVALDGHGFFTVAGDKGEKLLTRDGSFLIRNDGTLVTSAGGRTVLDSSGQPIKLNPILPVTIDGNGEISQSDAGGNAGQVKLGVVDVTDPRRLIKLGGNVMTVDKPDALKDAGPDTRVLQYQLENSGVDPLTETVAMWQGQRAFEANTRMISYTDQTMAQVNQVGRIA